MGMPGPLELFIVLVIVALLFGTKKLRSLGGDLGSAIKSFRGAIKEGEDVQETKEAPSNESNIIEGEATPDKDDPGQ